MEIHMTEAQYQARIRELEAALQEAIDYIENEADVIDGPYGPEPNYALSLASDLALSLNK